MQLRFGTKRTQCPREGFTLIELLTVISIIAVLGTLLLSVLISAKRKGRQAYCIGNLHQIGLAVQMYMTDHEKRPLDYALLVKERYAGTTNLFRCIEDKVGNWGGLVQPPFVPGSADWQPIPYSYLHPLHPYFWNDGIWQRFRKRENEIGVAVCQLHGIGKQSAFPSVLNFEGLILRGQLDGVVVRRQLFLGFGGFSRNGMPPIGSPIGTAPASGDPELGGVTAEQFFVDPETFVP